MLNKRILASLVITGQLFALSVLPSSAADSTDQTKVFTDVTGETQYEPAIKYLKDNNIVTGYPDGSFGPAKNINRAEFAKILIGAINSEKVEGKNCFPDVKDQWFASYVCTAKKMGLLEGYPDGNFKPEEQINFAEAAKIVANAFKLNKGDNDPAVWFKQYIEALQRENAIPLSVDYFDEKITRDEMSEIIWRVKADVNNKSSRTYLELQGEGLVQAKSCADLEERFKSIERPNYPIMYDMMREEAMPASTTSNDNKTAAPAADAASAPGGSGADDYSHTNTQVAGVDEADVIKNDGRYIYMIKGNNITIIDAYPASSMKELVNFQLGKQEEYFYPTEMYVSGNQLVAIGTSSVNYPMPIAETSVNTDAKMIAPPYYGGSKSKVFIVDISDRSKPKVTRTVDFDGIYRSSRRIDNTLYLVMNQYPYFPYYRSYNQPITNFTEYLPRMTDSANGSKVEQVSPCDQIRLMPKPRSFDYLITAAIPLDSQKEVSRNVIVGNSDNVFASENNLYIASTDWSGPYYYNTGSNTKIYKFDLSAGKLEYKAEGMVPGTVLNQFSMDEFRNNFRIATTTNTYSSGDEKQSNNLYVLDSGLKTIGKIENLAPGEKIYSVRFMGDRSYMVTFKYVDPLFVVDLADPTKPVVKGYLKIPGYSDYLHPYDETHVIGFGKDVDPATLDSSEDFVHYNDVRGFKMALFDVADPTNPKEMFHEIIGDQGTYSELLYNHKALLFSKDKNLIAFPISVTEMPKQEGPICSEYTYSTCPSSCNKYCQPKCTYENGVTICDKTCDGANSCQQSTYVFPKTVFIGAYVYGVDLQSGFKLKTKITHLNSDQIGQLLQNSWTDAYDKTIQRIIYIGDTLYTVSQGAVKANSLSTMQELKFLELSPINYFLDYVTPMA